ncbi:hypothetical protein J1605_021658 [Eschrichtius robustus]|uniref:EIPR1-like beta-propeller domain-containing protein n=1 Tax=Eschrichtius robustus TaxID=9764 RepID=A0AB34HGQ5_ESCRO|nr:hypothetical protein J1605_021658 [Eschrichtius robustus]
MEDDAPVIYGLEFQARALTPQTAETDAIRFLVGTQSLKYDNQIHIIDFDDENNIINKNVLLHQAGEIWHISASPADKGVLATCYNKTADGKVVTCAAVWRMPAELEPGGHESPEDAASPAHALELLCHLGPAAHGSTAWSHPGTGERVSETVQTRSHFGRGRHIQAASMPLASAERVCVVTTTVGTQNQDGSGRLVTATTAPARPALHPWPLRACASQCAVTGRAFCTWSHAACI